MNIGRCRFCSWLNLGSQGNAVLKSKWMGSKFTSSSHSPGLSSMKVVDESCDKNVRRACIWGEESVWRTQPWRRKSGEWMWDISLLWKFDGRNKSQSIFAPVFQRNQAIILRSGAALTPRASATLLRIKFARCRAKGVRADRNVVLKSNLQRLPGFLRKHGSCREWPQLCSIAWCLC